MKSSKENTIPLTVRFTEAEMETFKKWQAVMHISTQQLMKWAILHFIRIVEIDDKELKNYKLEEYIVALRSIHHKSKGLEIKT